MKSNRKFNRICALLLAAAMSFTLIASAFARSEADYSVVQISENTGNNALTESELSDSYIRVTEELYEQGITNGTCYEDYVSGYQTGDVTDLTEYEEQMIEAEIIAEEERQEILERNTTPIVDEVYQEAVAQREVGLLTEEELQTLAEYESLMESYASAGMNVSLSYEVYVETAETVKFEVPLETDEDTIQPASTSSSSKKWYDNIGSTSPILTQKPNYGTYNLRSVVKKGDIISESKGWTASITGHIAIVQGKYWSSAYQRYYLRLIEANGDGVVYGVLDDDRYYDRGITIYRVSSATTSNIKYAIIFCVNQLGKPYNYTAIANYLYTVANGKTLTERCSTSTSASRWYCSELVWAAYYYVGINLYSGSGAPLNIYFPAHLAKSSKLTKVTISG